ncbi:MAG: VWA domain-containing protein, partial [Pirellulaceae bacterium]
LTFAPDAWSSEFIQVGKDLEESQRVWQQFRGVYSFFACYEPKPAATIVASFSDPTTIVNGTAPIYLATQFYGSGRVAFQGGGEFWRLRDVGEGYFDTYYTKLVRWAGQGRLLKDSDRGMLLVDKEQAVVGDTVVVRAVLRDAQFQPLIQPEAVAKVLEPGGRSSQLRLRPIPDPNQAGVYVGQFITKRTGTYEVQLPIGTLADQIILTQQTVVRVPALEIQRPQRNDVLLNELATRTGGKYWIGLDSLKSDQGAN